MYWALGWIALFLFPFQTWASLGDPVSSIEKDRKALHGKMERMARVEPTRSGSNFSIHEMTVDGNKIQEYASSQGVVFAVTWQGFTQPDLSILLGSYFSEYQDLSAKPAARKGRTARVLRSKNIVIERSGHMRDIRGKAYVPELMPTGVRPEDLH